MYRIEDKNTDNVHFIDVHDESSIYRTTKSEVQRKNALMRELNVRDEKDVPDGHTIKAHRLIVTDQDANQIVYSAVDNIEIDYPINQIKWPFIRQVNS